MNQAIRTCLEHLVLVPALMAGLGLILAGQARAQTLTTLHNFTGGSDGKNPYAGLVLSGNILYGTAWGGGSLANGTVFAVNTDGTGFTVLHAFRSGSDGSSPRAGLVLSGGTLYGTAFGGGSAGDGTVFKINTTGTPFSVLHAFTGSDGAYPYGGLVLSGGTLYGTASQGGGVSQGIVFAVTTSGTGFNILHNFTVQSDGSDLQAGLLLSGSTLYGTAMFGGMFGGSSDNGTVFAVNTDGTAFTNVYSFTTLNHAANSDGAFPSAGLVQSAGTLYGTAAGGGSGANGTVFAVNTNGTGFAVLHTFTATSNYDGPNSDGTFPMAGLVLSGNTLYGTATDGGPSGSGTVFAVNTDGTGFVVLHSFAAINPSTPINSDGATPYAGLVVSSNILYGTAFEGGSSGYGTIFSLSLPVNGPELTVIGTGGNVILTWPANAAGFTLQSTTNLGPSAVWAAVSPGPVVVNGQNTVTNLISGTQKFYRLSN